MSNLPVRTETPHTNADVLVIGEFKQGIGYASWRPRGTGDWLLIHTAGGAGRITLPGGRTHELAVGETVLFPPGTPQDYATSPLAGRWHLLWTHFQPRPHWLPWLQWPRFGDRIGLAGLPEGEARTGVRSALTRMVRWARRRRPGSEPMAVNALEEALLWIHTATADSPWSRLDPRIRKALDLLTEELGTPFSLPAIARRCGLSPSRLSHLFREQTGRTVQQLAEEARIRHARELLAYTALPVQEIAEACGFASPFYFARRFRKATGRAPSSFRVQAKRKR